jgi:hypothetical protein
MNEVEVPAMPSRVKCGACRTKKRKEEAKKGWSRMRIKKLTPFGLMRHYLIKHPDSFTEDDLYLIRIVQALNIQYNEALDGEQG